MRDNWFCEYFTVYLKINSCIFLFKNPFTLLFKGIVSRDSIFIKFCEVISRHSCVRRCFALKGQCHKILCSRFFSGIIFPQASENPQICGLTKFVTFADLPHVWHIADLQFSDSTFLRFVDLRFADPNFFADLKLSQIWKCFILFFCLQIHHSNVLIQIFFK